MPGNTPRGVILARCLLLGLLIGGAWLALQPTLNLAHFTPNRWMRAMGMRYESILAYEHTVQWLLHALVAFALTWLLHCSRLLPPLGGLPRWIPAALTTLVLAIIAEALQVTVGRGFDGRDVIAGMVGIASAIPLLRR